MKKLFYEYSNGEYSIYSKYISDKTIKKDGWLSNDNYIINLEFYERFNDNINPKRKLAKSVGIYQIHTEDLENHRNYDKCVNGGISELEWKQERK